MKTLILLLSFTYLANIPKDIRLRVNVTECTSSVITVEYARRSYDIKLINMSYQYKDLANIYVCELIQPYSIIEMELDNSLNTYNKDTSINVWLFIDDSLVQERLIANNLATMTINNPHYKYTSDLQKAMPTSGEYLEQTTMEEYIPNNKGIKYLALLSILIVACIITLVMTSKFLPNKKFKDSMKKTSKEELPVLKHYDDTN